MFPRCFEMKYLEFKIIGGLDMIGDFGLLALRLVLGLVFMGHGAQKAFGAFGGPGLAGASGFMASLGLKPARFWAAVAAFSELLAGALLLVGVLMPIAAALIVATMVVAIAKVHGPKGFFSQNGGYEYNLVLLVAALTLAATGPGAYSLGHLLSR